jgi:hypothetical protein
LSALPIRTDRGRSAAGDGAEDIAAAKTCLDAIQGNIPAKVARAALIRAAEEAGVPVVPLSTDRPRRKTNKDRGCTAMSRRHSLLRSDDVRGVTTRDDQNG